ncbi:MAG: 50S ribosomal protein L15 [Patescibacteria group bacterium]
MVIVLHNLRSAKGARRHTKRVGRGNASGAGTYSGKGQKGQRARSGGRKRIIQRGVKHFIMRMPKQRGFKRQSSALEVLDVKQLEHLPETSVVDVSFLQKQGLVKGKLVKVIGNGKLTKRLEVRVPVSRGAKATIEAAGGSVEIVGKIQSSNVKSNPNAKN